MAFRADIIAGKAVILVNIQDTIDAQLRTIRAKIRRFSNSLSDIGGDIFRAGAVGVVGSIFPIKEFVEFQDSLLFLQTKLKDTGADINKLETFIRDLGKSTSFTSQEVAEAAVVLAQAGLGASIPHTLQPTLDLARASRVDMDVAGRILANSITAFGRSFEEANVIASRLVTATRLGTLDLVDLGDSLKYSAGTFRQLNIGLEESVAMITTLSNVSHRASLAGTSLNAAFSNLAAKPDQLKEALGITITDEEVQRPVLVLQKLRDAMADMGTQEKQAVLSSLFNIRGGRAISGMLIQELDTVSGILDKIRASTDEARKSAELMDSKLGGAFRITKSAFQELMLTIGGTSEGPLTDFLRNMQNVFNDLSKLTRENPKVIQTLLLIPPAALGAGAALLSLGWGLNKVASLITPLVSLNNLLFNSLQKIVTGNWDAFKSLKTIFRNARLGFLGFLTALNGLRRLVFSFSGVLLIVEALILFGPKIPPIARAMEAAGKAIRNAFAGLGQMFRDLGPAFSLLWDGFKTIFTGDAVGGINRIKDSLGFMADIISTRLTVVWNNFLKDIEGGVVAIRGFIEGAKETFNALAVGLESIFGAVLRGGSIIIKGDGALIEAFRMQNFQALMAGLVATIGTVAEKLTSIVQVLTDIGVYFNIGMGNLLKGIAAVTPGADTEAIEFGQHLIDSAMNAGRAGLMSRIDALYAQADKATTQEERDAIAKEMQRLLEIYNIEDPFRRLDEIGRESGESLRNSIDEIINRISNWDFGQPGATGGQNAAASGAANAAAGAQSANAFGNFIESSLANLRGGKVGKGMGEVISDMMNQSIRNMTGDEVMNIDDYLPEGSEGRQRMIDARKRYEAAQEFGTTEEQNAAWRDWGRLTNIYKRAATREAATGIKGLPNLGEFVPTMEDVVGGMSGIADKVGGLLSGRLGLSNITSPEIAAKKEQADPIMSFAKSIVGSFSQTQGQQLQAVKATEDENKRLLGNIDDKMGQLVDAKEPFVFQV